jgi:putative SOS response-associated peptidase YedK
LVLASRWDRREDRPVSPEGVAVPTVEANDRVWPGHDRMPVIVPPDNYAEWLDPQTRKARLVSLLKPYRADEMTVAEVGPAVNSPRNDGPECLDAA